MEIKSCPLCGKDAKVFEELYKCADDSYLKYLVVVCKNCGLVLIGDEHEDGEKFTCDEIESLVERWNMRTPTADVAKVVRCKDCRFCHYNSSSGSHNCRRRGYFSESVQENDFCSYGERKEQE